MVDIIAIVNQKGGVGKTTTVLNLSSALALAGYKVLVVDSDPQANLTIGLDQLNKLSFYDYLTRNKNIKQVLLELIPRRLFLIPGSNDLAGLEVELLNTNNRHNLFKLGLQSITKNFDFILLDAPPSLSLITINILNLANGILVPVICDKFSQQGIRNLLNTVQLIKHKFHKKLEIYGMFVNMYEESEFHMNIYNKLKENYKDLLFTTKIRKSDDILKVNNEAKSLFKINPSSKAIKDYMSLARELIDRRRMDYENPNR